jgi:acyl-CoA thioesterase
VSGPYELDIDTELDVLEAGRYAGELAERWNVGIGMNGGYLAAFCLRAVLEQSALTDPLTMTIHYLSRPVAGPAEVHVTAMRVGRGHATYRFELVQAAGVDHLIEDGAEIRATGLVMTGRLRAAGSLDFAPVPPEVPGPEASSAVRRISAPGESVSIWNRLETRIARADDMFFLRTEPGEARTGGWTRLVDGRPSDALCVPLFLDCWPPAVFSRTMRPDGAGAPTLELTVRWRNRVPPGWLYARFESRLLAGGYVDEEGELWTEDGVLVAQSSQLARYAGTGEGFA